MKTKTIELYTVSELKERFPQAFTRAHDRYNDSIDSETPWMEETCESLKTIIRDCDGVNLEDWNLGAYNRSNCVEVSFGNEEVEEFTGKRAMAWLENNLLAKYRVPFVSMTGSKQRREFVKYGAGYRPGMIRPCPATGYCADEDFIQSLRDSLRNGDTLKEAFENLASVCAKLLESECEAAREEDAFIETAEANEWLFTSAGKREDA